MAAYQALGQFISTFAVPEQSGFDVDEDGTLIRCKKVEVASSNASDDMPPLEDPSLESDRQIMYDIFTFLLPGNLTGSGGFYTRLCIFYYLISK